MKNQKLLTSVLVSITGLIHFFIGIVSTLGEFTFLNLSLIANGLGYFAILAALYYLPQFSDMEEKVRLLLIAYTAVTFVAYFVIFLPTEGIGVLTNLPGVTAKIVEAIIIFTEFSRYNK